MRHAWESRPASARPGSDAQNTRRGRGWAAGQPKVKRGAEDGLPGRPLPAGGWSAVEKWRNSRAAGGGRRPARRTWTGPTPFDRLHLQSRALAGEDGGLRRRELGGCASYSPGGGVPLLSELTPSPSSWFPCRMQVRGRPCGKKNKGAEKPAPSPGSAVPQRRLRAVASSAGARPGHAAGDRWRRSVDGLGQTRAGSPGNTEAVAPRHREPSRAAALLCRIDRGSIL